MPGITPITSTSTSTGTGAGEALGWPPEVPMTKVALSEMVRRHQAYVQRCADGGILPERPQLVEAIAGLLAATWPEVPLERHAAAVREMLFDYKATLEPQPSLEEIAAWANGAPIPDPPA